MSLVNSTTLDVTPESEALMNDYSTKPVSQDMKQTELYENPSASWETAYIWAFIFKFTSLSRDIQFGLRIQNVMDLENILEKGDREILTAIVKTFHENLKLVNTANWERWLAQYVDTILKGKKQVPMYNLFKWEQNYLKTRQEGFWDLNWKEKVHLLRTLVDHQLAYSAKIRATIDENYDKALTKAPKNSAAVAAAATKRADSDQIDARENPLLIQSLGLDRYLKTWWQIDESPRMYCSGNPHKSSCTWAVLTSTEEEVAAVQSRLESDPSLLSATSSSNGDEEPKKRPRGKVPAMFLAGSKVGETASTKEDYLLRQEWQLSKAIENVVKPKIELGKKRIQKILEEQARLEAIESRRQRRLVDIENQKIRNIALAGDFAGGRSGRLRTQVHKPDYAVDSVVTDREFERELQKFQKRPSNRKQTDRKRCRTASNDDDTDAADESWDEAVAEEDEQNEDNAEFNNDEDFDAASGSLGTGRGKRAANKNGGRAKRQKNEPSTCKVAPVGERRSSRVKNKVLVEEEVEEEEIFKVEAAPEPAQPVSSSAWSRAQAPPTSPGQIQGPENDCTPSELDGNVSIWSRGKLVYVAGNNKYASKPVALPPRKGSIAKSSSRLAVKTLGAGRDCTSESADNSIASGKSNSLANLQARLASMGNEEDDGNDSEAGAWKHLSAPATELNGADGVQANQDSISDNDPLSSIFDMDEPLPSDQMASDTLP